MHLMRSVILILEQAKRVTAYFRTVLEAGRHWQLITYLSGGLPVAMFVYILSVLAWGY